MTVPSRSNLISFESAGIAGALIINALVAARDKLKFSGLSARGRSYAILLVYMNWLAMWELRSGGDWNLLSITVTFLFSLSICFICTLAVPQVLAEGPIDMDAFYWRQRKTYYWSWIVCETLAIVANLTVCELPHGVEIER